MLAIQRITCVVLLVIILPLVTSGCINTVPPAPSPQPTPDQAALTPESAVTGFWSDIDSGQYSDAYGLAYHERNVSYEGWISDHEATYGKNGSYIEIHKFAVSESFPLAPDTFEGNFSEVQVVVIDTKMAYMGNNRTGTVQFPAVKTGDGWKIYGDY